MNISMTLSIREMEYDDLDREIKRTMRRSAKEVVQLGFMLRQMMGKRLWAAAFDCFDAYLEEELHIDYTTANRLMNINRKYSVSGDSMEIAAEYEEYSQGLLTEMLNMPPELEAKVTPDMTVKQAREIKRRAKAEKEAPARQVMEKRETVIDGEYREIKEAGTDGENIATSQSHDAGWFIRQYVEIMPKTAAELFEVCHKEQNNSDRAGSIQKHMAPYGYGGSSCSEYSFTFHGFAAGMDFRIGDEKIHLKYGRFAAELMKILDDKLEEQQERKPEKENIATSQSEGESCQGEMLSPYGLSKTVYPEGSLLTTVGCGHKYNCSSCAQECAIRQEDRYCMGAPLGNPFNCTMMHVLGNIKTELGEQCQFINLGMADHAAGSNEPDPCCKKCNNESCGYRCQRSWKSRKTETEDSDMRDEEEYVPEGRLPVLRYLLEQKKNSLDAYSKAGCLPEVYIRRDKSIIEALSAIICDLENARVVSESEETAQLELPRLKTNDQRKEWLHNYKEWGLWYRDENIDVNYYKYDFEDGSRLVVAEYPQRYGYWEDEPCDEHYFHLLEKNKKVYGKTYDEQYGISPDSETYLVDFLKKLQKKG